MIKSCDFSQLGFYSLTKSGFVSEFAAGQTDMYEIDPQMSVLPSYEVFDLVVLSLALSVDLVFYH